jgi:site-specific DNA recombinase
MTARLAAVPDTPPRAVLYLRQSTYREESISLELQETAGRDYAARHGYQVVDVLADPGISGRTWKRPAVQRAMTMLEEHDVDVVILWRWSRLSRNRKDWALAADRADVAGGRIESATEPNDITAAGRFTRGVMTELAAFESERIGEQWRDIQARRSAIGLPHSGRPRFGYTYDPTARTYAPDPATGPVLADLYARYLAGAGLVALTRHMLDLGAGSPYSAKPYTHRGIGFLLDSGFGAGLLHVHGQHIAGAHQPVIDDATWRTYTRERVRRATIPPRLRGATASPLSGVARCTTCGSRLALQRRADGPSRMRCSTLACTARVSVLERRVEAIVLAWLPTVAATVDALAARVAATGVDGAGARRRAQVVIADADEALTRLTIAHARGLIPEGAYAAARDELVGERGRAQRVIDTLEVAERTVIGADRAAARLLELWGDLAPGEASGMLRELVTVWVTKTAGVRGCAIVARGVWEE